MCATMSVASIAGAVPTLQLYIEGATYIGGEEETWVFNTSDGVMRLWVIADTSDAAINDVRLAIAYDSSLTPSITLTGSTIDGLGGFDDPSLASDPGVGTVMDAGTSPILTGGNELPSHGIYGEDTQWQEFSLGDFNLVDSPLANFSTDVVLDPGTGLPAPLANQDGQISVYDIVVDNWTHGFSLHFDVYDTIAGSNHGIFAPFSKDAVALPEPMSAIMLGALGLGMFATRKVRRRIK